MDVLGIILAVLCGAVALLLVVDIVRDRNNTNPPFFGMIAIEAGLVVQLVWGLARLTGDHDGVEVGAYVGYLLGAPLLIPVGWLWGASEKNRAGTAVVLVAVLVVPVLLLRLHHLWNVHG
ncbi:4-amino-4-deoxy-L-arabinose transferase-like glycosyltransferase [Marmoricola sp. OAE513]|uniref:hypothetical protein n=1 Tax=Marmoricola sp. OAE513 TaxID=2817894 RepID=UPI001AE1C2D3